MSVDEAEVPKLEIQDRIDGGDHALHLSMAYGDRCAVAYREKAQIEEGVFRGYVLRFLSQQDGGEVTFIHPQNKFTLQVQVRQFNKNQSGGELDEKANEVADLIDKVQGKLTDLYDHSLIGDQEMSEGQELLEQIVGDMRRNSNFFNQDTAKRMQELFSEQ